MKLSITTESKEIPENHRVYMLQAGKGRRFFRDFLKKKRVFMDLPGAKLPDGFELSDKIKKELQKSYALGAYLADTKDMKRPPRQRKEYDPNKGYKAPKGEISPWKSVDKHTMNACQTLYLDMEPGDLVVVPSKGGGGASVLIGEIVGEYQEKDAIPSSYYDHNFKKYPARRVKWLSKRAQKHQFSVAANKAFGHPRAMHTVGSSIRKEIYDHAYGQYIFSEGSNMNIDILPPAGLEIDPEKWQVDLSATHSINTLILYYGGFFNAIEAGREEEYAALTVAQAIMHPLAQDDPFSLESSIHSPGMNTYRAAQNTMKAIFVSAALSLNAYGAENPDVVQEFQEFQEVEVTYDNRWNKQPTDCDLGLGEKLSSMMLHIGYENYRQNCELQRIASEKLSAESSAKMKVGTKDDEDQGG